MPTIRPISDLRNNATEISDYCHRYQEPVFITKNGTGDMVILSIEEYERQSMLLDLHAKLSIAEAESEAGLGEDFEAFAKDLRGAIYGRL